GSAEKSLGAADTSVCATVHQEFLRRTLDSRHRGFPELERVSESALRVDQFGIGRIDFHLLPETQDIDVHRTVSYGAVLAPDGVQQLVAAKHDALTTHHEFEQPELGCGEWERVAV